MTNLLNSISQKMLHTETLGFRMFIDNMQWMKQQTRCKKYLPFYIETRKRAAHKRTKKIIVSNKSDHDESTDNVDTEKLKFVTQLATPSQALEVLRSFKCAETISSKQLKQHTFNLWTKVDVKRVALRGMTMLPHPVGPKPKVVAICEDDEARLAIECGAAYAGLDNILERIAGGWTNFDTCVTTTVHMPKLVKVARILGPKKLMPNMKEGTLASNLLDAVRRMSSANSVQFRALPINVETFQILKYLAGNKKFDYEVDQIGVIEVPIAEGDASPKVVIENSKHFINEVIRQRPNIATKTNSSDFQWPPPRRSANAILESFVGFGTESQADDDFIVGAALGMSIDGTALLEPILIDPIHLR
ncbi:Ribosomal protein L1p/L10e family protein [Babesia bovis T2Bo]|uniref:Ribosomal protein L1, putative n=1 Tax=Babesia bovis TaxID=5865 RepID=A7AS54_BABBO|nr:Ribosomal protein L1p/L10e family protein [Babesia bovis T2Bo]EDO07373.1 Ribosomal protein L1p/L10e family protein [Babesia bovis T2Bo]|eukprot:XP_001610941.1 ribosomal protein L1 [Babesia bovis T2Bo]